MHESNPASNGDIAIPTGEIAQRRQLRRRHRTCGKPRRPRNYRPESAGYESERPPQKSKTAPRCGCPKGAFAKASLHAGTRRGPQTSFDPQPARLPPDWNPETFGKPMSLAYDGEAVAFKRGHRR